MNRSPFPELPPILAGTWRMHEWKRSPAELARWIGGVLERGVDTFDLADIYGRYTAEGAFGSALASDAALRSRVRIVTKCNIRVPAPARPENRVHIYDSTANYIVESAERSLFALGVERIDLLLLHRQDPLCDPDEVAEAFMRLARSGKVASFGLSNATPSYFSMLEARVPVPLVTNQVEASLLHLDPFLDGTFDQALERRFSPMAWSPLGGGRLFSDGAGDERVGRVRRALSAVVKATGAPVEAVALAFLMRHPSGVRPVVGTGDLERLSRLLRARDLKLSREDWFDLWRASTGEPLP